MALNQAKRDRQRGRLSDNDEQFILQATRDIVDELGTERAQSALASQEGFTGAGDDASGALRKVRIIGCPVALTDVLSPLIVLSPLVGRSTLAPDAPASRGIPGCRATTATSAPPQVL